LAEERTTIGREPRNDIQIDNLAVSGEHAAIASVANDCIPEDLGSTNGTLVNGTPVTRHILRDNNVIELGEFKLRFVGTGTTKTDLVPVKWTPRGMVV
jgi:pSer/pThr/pTyr-binding forkhead associated (FHA) protein